MLEMIKMLILAVIQGISEWFPISSSGHLVIFSQLLGFANSVQFDVALHFGTLMAVFVYFGKDIVDIVEALLKGDWKSKEAKLGFLIIVASIPAAVIGFLFKKLFESAFSSLLIVMVGFAITSLILFIASFYVVSKKKEITYNDSWIIGFAQAVAIIPGISRSGATISAGLLRGIELKEAMKFSFLMAIPAVFGASILELGSGTLPVSYIWPTLLAFVVGLASIHFLLKIVGNSKRNLMWFAVYDILLALISLFYLLLR
jgi:undecaprenyl-diphosphatase